MVTSGLPLRDLGPSSHAGHLPSTEDTLSAAEPAQTPVSIPIISPNDADPQTHPNAPNPTPHHTLLNLYLSHTFSTWNSRSFEFGAVLFLAHIFPTTLLPLSIYALIRSASAIVLGPTVGRVIDQRGRLGVVRFSIGEFTAARNCLPDEAIRIDVVDR